MSDDKISANVARFERLWEGRTSKGINRTKRMKFRQYILEHVRQKKRPLTKENARKYWTGELQREIQESEQI